MMSWESREIEVVGKFANWGAKWCKYPGLGLSSQLLHSGSGRQIVSLAPIISLLSFPSECGHVYSTRVTCVAMINCSQRAPGARDPGDALYLCVRDKCGIFVSRILTWFMGASGIGELKQGNRSLVVPGFWRWLPKFAVSKCSVCWTILG